MAAGTAGDDVVNMRIMMDGMSDSITTFQNQMASLLEDDGQFWTRYQQSPDGSLGPSVRERTYAHTLEADRITMQEVQAVINTSTQRIN